MALQFAVRIGIPGCLTIEIQALPSLINSKPPNLTPQLNAAVLGSAFGAIANTPDQLFSKTWGQGFMTPVSQRLIALGGNTSKQLLTFECPSLDTTDMAWGAQGSIDGTTDPAQVTAPLFGASIYGRTFAPGDYILWNDPSIVNSVYQYEIDQIVSVKGSVFTLARRDPNGGSGAQFGSVLAPHANIQFFKLIDKTFDVLWQGEWQVYQFLWANMIVAAVSANTVGL